MVSNCPVSQQEPYDFIRTLVREEDIRIVHDLPQFFEFYKVINAKALSQRIGMNQSLLAQYIKGNKKPSPAQKKRILKGVQKVGRELAEVSLFH
jgi:hypothetical protein